MARVVVEDCRGGQCDYLCAQFKHDGHKMVVAKNPEHWVPDASTLVLADFSGSCKVQHPSEAVNVESFGFPSHFCRASACYTLQNKNVSYGLLAGDAFVSNESLFLL